MMRKRIIFLLFCLFSYISSSFSQSERRVWGGVEVAGGITLHDSGKKYDIMVNSHSAMTSIRVVLGYYVVPQVSLGTGIGFDNYTKVELQTMPFLFDIRFHPLKENMNLVLVGNAGYLLLTNERNLKGKYMSEIALGYKINKGKAVNITPMVGYNFNAYHMEYSGGLNKVEINSDEYKHSLFVKLSISY